MPLVFIVFVIVIALLVWLFLVKVNVHEKIGRKVFSSTKFKKEEDEDEDV